MWAAIQTVVAWVIVAGAAVCMSSLLWLVTVAVVDWIYRHLWLALFSRPGTPAALASAQIDP
jgi:hypothetical protein